MPENNDKPEDKELGDNHPEWSHGRKDRIPGAGPIPYLVILVIIIIAALIYKSLGFEIF